MDLGMDKEDLLPSSGPYHSQQHYHSCLFWFKIVTLTIQTAIGEGPNTRGEEGCLDLRPQDEEDKPHP